MKYNLFHQSYLIAEINIPKIKEIEEIAVLSRNKNIIKTTMSSILNSSLIQRNLISLFRLDRLTNSEC